MIEEKEINTLDIFKDEKLVASIITDSETSIVGSDEAGFHIRIGTEEIIIAAEKVEQNT